MKLSEKALVVMDMRLGRMGKMVDFLMANPHSLNEKIFPSQEYGVPKLHSLLEVAIVFGFPQTINWLCSKGAVETPETSPNLLLLATQHRNMGICQKVMDMGFKPWKTYPFGLSAMIVAAGIGWDDGLMDWKRQGYSLRRLDKEGRSLLHHAIQNASNLSSPNDLKRICTLLFQSGVVWKKDKGGLYPNSLAPHYLMPVAEEIEEMWQVFKAKKTKKALRSVISGKKSPSTKRKM